MLWLFLLLALADCPPECFTLETGEPVKSIFLDIGVELFQSKRGVHAILTSQDQHADYALIEFYYRTTVTFQGSDIPVDLTLRKYVVVPAYAGSGVLSDAVPIDLDKIIRVKVYYMSVKIISEKKINGR